MATAGSLVINVAADASRLEKGFAQARAKTKSFATDTVNQLKGVQEQANKLASLGNANLGMLAGSLIGGAAGGFLGGQLDEMLEFSDKLDLNPIKNFKEILDLATGAKEREEQKGFAESWDKQAAAIKQSTVALEAQRIELERGGEAARRHAAMAQLPTAGGAISVEMVQQQKALLEADLKQNEAARQRLEVEKEINKVRQERIARDEKASQTLHGLRQQVHDLGLSGVDKKLAQLERGGLNKPELRQARRHLEAIDAHGRARAMAERVIAEQDRMAALDKVRAIDPGGTGALRFGEAATFSAERKFQRMVEAAGAKPAAAEKDGKRIAEKMLEVEKAQLKRLEDMVDELAGQAKLKVAKF